MRRLAPYVFAVAVTSTALRAQTVPVARAPDSDALTASVLAASADSAEKLQDAAAMRESISLSLRAAALFERAARPAERAQRFHNVARVYRVLGELDSALAYAVVALRLRRALDDRRAEAATLGTIANVYLTREQLDTAVHYYGLALALQHVYGTTRAEATTLANIGSTFRLLGRPDSALRYFRRAVAIRSATADTSAATAQTLSNVGATYADVGRFDSTLFFYGKALAVQRALHARGDEATTLNNIGALHADLHRPDSALRYIRASLDLRRALGVHTNEAAVLGNIGAAHDALGRPDSAMRYYAEALTVARAAQDRAAEGAALHDIGDAYVDRGMTDSASYYLTLALALRRELHDRREGETLGTIGRLYLGRHDMRRGVAYLDTAAAMYARLRRQTGDDANAISFAEGHRELFARWALGWLARDDVDADVAARAALAVAERGRAQALLDLQRALEGGGAAAAGPGGDLPAEADALLAPLRRAHTAALSYLVTADTLVTWLALPDGSVRAARAAVGRDSLAALVRAARDAMDGPDAARAPLARLAALLLPAELRARLPAAGDLVVVPNGGGALSIAPVAALPVGRGEALGTRYAVRLAPSLATLAAAEARAALPTGAARRAALASALVVGNAASNAASNAAASPALAPLPGAEREARWVAARLGARPLVGRGATESAVWARLARARVVHLATHGVAFSSDAQARESYVALAADSASDGLLTAGELLDDSRLALTADLVVLSACETGLGDLTDAEGTVGLARAFLAKGARSVLVSLWRVSDEATELLMRRLYAHWLDDADGPSKAEALRRAQADVRAMPGFAHPRYWAAFQLVGAR